VPGGENVFIFSMAMIGIGPPRVTGGIRAFSEKYRHKDLGVTMAESSTHEDIQKVGSRPGVWWERRLRVSVKS